MEGEDRRAAGADAGDAGAAPDANPVVYPVFGEIDDQTLTLARHVGDGVGREVYVLDLVRDGQSVTAETRDLAGSVLESRRAGTQIQPLVEATDAPVSTAIDVARTLDADLVVLDNRLPGSIAEAIRGTVPERIASDVPADVVSLANPRPVKRISSILVPVADGPHSTVAAHVAAGIATSANAVVELFHVTEPSTGAGHESASALFDATLATLPAGTETETWHVEAEDVASAVVEQSDHYDLTIIGTPTASRLQRIISRSVTDDVERSANNCVLVARRGDGRRFRG